PDLSGRSLVHAHARAGYRHHRARVQPVRRWAARRPRPEIHAMMEGATPMRLRNSRGHHGLLATAAGAAALSLGLAACGSGSGSGSGGSASGAGYNKAVTGVV